MTESDKLWNDIHREAKLLAAVLNHSTSRLSAAVAAWRVPTCTAEVSTVNPLQPIIDAVTAATTVAASATALINGFSAQLTAAVNAALGRRGHSSAGG